MLEFHYDNLTLFSKLLVGDFGLSIGQQQMQMAIWSVMTAPLFVSADFRKMPTESKQLLLHNEIIRINQDPLGHMGQQIDVVSTLAT